MTETRTQITGRRPGRRGAAALGLLLGLAPAAAFAQPAGETVGVLPAAAFWLLAGLTVVSAAGVAFSRNIVYAAFSLLGTFLGVAGLYVFLSADFLAVAQVLIYIGGVLVLILFAVMLTSRIREVRISNQGLGMIPALLTALATAGLLGFVAVRAQWSVRPGGTAGPETTADTLGRLFLNEYLLPFEIASVLLLAALIGAVVMARKEIKPE